MLYQKILILGATGKIGRLVLTNALKRGYTVTVVVRSKSRIVEHDRLRVIEGSVLDDAVLSGAMKSQDAVLSCLGVLRKNQNNPWSEVIPPANLTELTTTKSLKLMKEFNVDRFISISAAGVGDSESILTFPMKTLIKMSNVNVSFADLDKMEAAMERSSIDTLALRPVGLKDGVSTHATKIVDKCGIFTQIPRVDVADWMLDALERPGRFESLTEVIGT